MRGSRLARWSGAALTAGLETLGARGDLPKPQTVPQTHLVATLDQANWTPPPKNLIRGTPSVEGGGGRFRYALVSGDPTSPGVAYTIRLSCSDGYKVAQHWHPADENIVVLGGTLGLGTGDTFDAASLRDTPSGAYIFMPRRMNHFALCKGETDLLVYGTGPYQVNFLARPPASKA